MLHSSYNRAPRRKLIPNLFSVILQVVASSPLPMTEHDIVEAVAQKMDRYDEELKRQITVSLNDAIIYGYLQVRDFRYSIVPSSLDPETIVAGADEPSSSMMASVFRIASRDAERNLRPNRIYESSEDIDEVEDDIEDDDEYEDEEPQKELRFRSNESLPQLKNRTRFEDSNQSN